MAKAKPSDIIVTTFASHKVITQPNPLRKVLRPGRAALREYLREKGYLS